MSGGRGDPGSDVVFLGRNAAREVSAERHFPASPVPARRTQRERQLADMILVAICAVLALLHGRALVDRGVDLGPDIPVYAATYESQFLEPFRLELLWGLLVRAGGSLGAEFDDWLFFLIVAQNLLWAVFAWQMARLIGMERAAVVALPLVLVLLFTYPFLLSGQVNTLRAGLAIPLGALAAVAYLRESRGLLVALLAASIGFHTEVGLIMLAGILGFIFVRRRVALAAFFAACVVYALGLSELVWHSVIPAQFAGTVARYGLGSEYDHGVRLDFLAFTVAMMMLVALLTWSASPGGYTSRSVPWLTFLSMPFLLVGGTFAYADRYLSPMWAISAVLVGVLAVGRLRPVGQFLAGSAATLVAAAVLVLDFAYGSL